MDKAHTTSSHFVMVCCLHCNWVHMGVSREYAEEQVAKFNEYFENLSPEQRELYYNDKPASITSYEECNCCGGSWENFRLAKNGDCPAGCTIGPIISTIAVEK